MVCFVLMSSIRKRPLFFIVSTNTKIHTVFPHIVALLLYILMACVATFPLIFNLNGAFPSMPNELSQDLWQNIWNIWWIKKALLVDYVNPYTTPMLFYPKGASLYLHTLNLPLGLVGMLLLPLFGIVATYNILTLIVLVLAGYCSFLLAGYVVKKPAAAMVAGTIVLYSPHRLLWLRSAQLPTISDYAVPLAILALLIALERKTWRTAALTGVAMLLAGLSSWYHLFHILLTLPVLAIWYAVQAWKSGKPALRQNLLAWGRITSMSALCILPFLLPAALEASTASYARKSDDLIASASVLQFVPELGSVFDTVSPAWQYRSLVAAVPLLLAMVGVAMAPRQAARWVMLGVFCWILSLGPHLIIGNTDAGIALPYAIFRHIPVVETFRAPVRINTITTLVLAVLAALAIARLSERIPMKLRWSLAPLAIVLLMLEVLRLPFPLVDAEVSPFYTQIADEPGEWSVLELPLDRPERLLLEMYAQTYHGKYILTGQTSRSVPRMPYESAAPIAQVEQSTTEADIVTMSISEREQLFRALRVRYLIVHPDPHNEQRADQQVAVARKVWGSLTEVYRDSWMQAYRLDEVAAWLDENGNSTSVDVPLYLGLDQQWEAKEAGTYGLSRWLPPDGAGFWVYTPHDRRVVLELFLYSLPGKRPLEIWLNDPDRRQDSPLQTVPIRDGLIPRRYTSAPFHLPAGTHRITLYAPMGGISPYELGVGDDKRALSFSIHHARLVDLEP